MDLTVQEILQDTLVCEKFLADMYAQFMKDSSCVPLLDLCLENYEQVIKTQHVMFLEMHERDFYPTTPAEAQKIKQTITTIKQNTKNYSDSF